MGTTTHSRELSTCKSNIHTYLLHSRNKHTTKNFFQAGNCDEECSRVQEVYRRPAVPAAFAGLLVRTAQLLREQDSPQVQVGAEPHRLLRPHRRDGSRLVLQLQPAAFQTDGAARPRVAQTLPVGILAHRRLSSRLRLRWTHQSGRNLLPGNLHAATLHDSRSTVVYFKGRLCCYDNARRVPYIHNTVADIP